MNEIQDLNLSYNLSKPPLATWLKNKRSEKTTNLSIRCANGIYSGPKNKYAKTKWNYVCKKVGCKASISINVETISVNGTDCTKACDPIEVVRFQLNHNHSSLVDQDFSEREFISDLKQKVNANPLVPIEQLYNDAREDYAVNANKPLSELIPSMKDFHQYKSSLNYYYFFRYLL